MTRSSCAILLTLAVLSAGSASRATAQSTAADPKACAPGERMQPGDATTGQGPRSERTENLSDKLARTDGVICPPNVGSSMQLPTPDAGRTPVIPPPGSPGGDPSIPPK
jgi:hypothetical protein